jgi:hypothetical protein
VVGERKSSVSWGGSKSKGNINSNQNRDSDSRLRDLPIDIVARAATLAGANLLNNRICQDERILCVVERIAYIFKVKNRTQIRDI